MDSIIHLLNNWGLQFILHKWPVTCVLYLPGTATAQTHPTSCQSGYPKRFGELNSSPVLTPQNLFPSQWTPVLVPIYSLWLQFTVQIPECLDSLPQSVAQNLPVSDVCNALMPYNFALFQKSRQNHCFNIRTEALSSMVFAKLLAVRLFSKIHLVLISASAIANHDVTLQ